MLTGRQSGESSTVSQAGTPETKACTKCKETKSVDCFYAWKQRGSSGRPQCKLCERDRSRKWVEANREKKKSYDVAHSRLPVRRFRQLKLGASRRKKTVEMTLLEYTALIAEPCEYCGFPNVGCGGGLDRMDNHDTVYTTRTACSCCDQCNKMKSNFFTYAEMKTIGGPAVARIKLARMNGGNLLETDS